MRNAPDYPGPVLMRVVTDYHRRPVRWIHAARNRFVHELTPEQRRRFIARAATRRWIRIRE